jgi:Mrp family chromosome partitioning ATPase
VRIIAGLAIGIALGAIIVLARELLDKRIRSQDRAESTFGFPVLVELPGSSRSVADVARSLAVVNSPESLGAEAYRMLRMSVLFESLAPKGNTQSTGFDLLLGNGILGNGHSNGNGNGNGHGAGGRTDDEARPDEIGRRQVVLVVSAGTEATRSQVVVNFAAAYAEAGQRALVISTVELGNGPLGVATGRVTGEVTPDDVEARFEPSRIERIYGLPLADFVDNSAQLVTRAPAVIEAARSVADVIVVEAPPLLTVHHAEALSRAVDVVLVVGECWTTTFDDARRAGDLLRRMDAPVLGVVLTNARISRRAMRQAAARVGQEPALASESPDDESEELVGQYSVAGATTQTEA